MVRCNPAETAVLAGLPAAGGQLDARRGDRPSRGKDRNDSPVLRRTPNTTAKLGSRGPQVCLCQFVLPETGQVGYRGGQLRTGGRDRWEAIKE